MSLGKPKINNFCLILVLSQLCGRLRLIHFHDVVVTSYKTQTGEEVTGEMDEFFVLS